MKTIRELLWVESTLLSPIGRLPGRYFGRSLAKKGNRGHVLASPETEQHCAHQKSATLASVDASLQHPAFDSAVFRDVVGRFASGVTVITTNDAGQDFGMTASAMSSLSLDPPMILICVNRRAASRQAISHARVFGVNILHEDQASLAVHFATPQPDKFRALSISRGALGCPRLEGVLAWLECEVVEEIEGGTHSVYFGKVKEAAARDGRPLAYFRGQFGQLYSRNTDPVAVSLREHVLGRLGDDEVLDLENLAHGLGVGVPDIQRSLSSLMADGVVYYDVEHGYRVRHLTEQRIARSVEAACAIEMGALDMAFGGTTDRPSTNEIESVAMAVAELERILAQGNMDDSTSYARTNSHLHEAIVSLARSPELLDAYRRLAVPGMLARALGFADGESVRERQAEHRRILECLRAGDLAGAREALFQHARNSQVSRVTATRNP
jgi:flavin reductase (DIM6/NTAB) family NADH-FMN oxidoreductase RutF/DNA-binding FadR family transcriptional regulator